MQKETLLKLHSIVSLRTVLEGSECWIKKKRLKAQKSSRNGFV